MHHGIVTPARTFPIEFCIRGLEVDGLAVGRHSRLLERLTHGGMSVASAANVLSTRAILHRQHALGDHFTRIRRHDVDAEHAVSFFVCEELDHAVGLARAHRPRSRVGHEGELAHLVGNARRLEILLRLAHRCHLGESIDDARDRIVVDVAAQAGDLLDDGDTLLLGLVCEHRTAHDVANGPDARHIGGEVVVHLHHATGSHLDPHVLEPKPFGEGHAPRGEQHNVRVERLLIAALDRLDSERGAAARFDRRAQHLGGHLELHSLLLQNPLEGGGDLRVDPGRDVVEKLDHLHLGAQPTPDGAHLEADDTGTDDDHLLRYLLELECACRGADRLLVHRHARQRGRHRASSDHNVLRVQRRRVAALDRRHLDGAGLENLARPLEVVHLILFEQALDAACQPGHSLLLVLHKLAQVHLHVLGGDAVRPPAVRRLLVQVRRVQ
mmetsp:Transcript_9535/g.19290  ORF Transcript_9535/g.19290 Transcript_9535/m.19290 type:complete len:440 (-) Transcript_9535:248-1567(-)